jgi:hypothetical protein
VKQSSGGRAPGAVGDELYAQGRHELDRRFNKHRNRKGVLTVDGNAAVFLIAAALNLGCGKAMGLWGAGQINSIAATPAPGHRHRPAGRSG